VLATISAVDAQIPVFNIFILDSSSCGYCGLGNGHADICSLVKTAIFWRSANFKSNSGTEKKNGADIAAGAAVIERITAQTNEVLALYRLWSSC
jgi:hypothetical protein